MLAFAAALVILTTLVVGIAPAIHARRCALMQNVRFAGGRVPAAGTLARGLVVSEVALGARGGGGRGGVASTVPWRVAIGKRLRFYTCRRDSQEKWREIVGVVADVRQYQLDRAPTMQVYVPQAQSPSTAMVLVIHTSGPPRAFVGAIRQQIRELDPELAAFQISTMEELVGDSLATRRLALALVGSFAMLALVLGAIGLYGVISHWVSQHTHEMAIRIALGARPRQVQHFVMGLGLRLTALGAVGGAGLALAFSRSLSAHVFEVPAADPLTLVVAVAILTGSAVLATYLPARRATRVDPVDSLRAQ